MAWVLLATSATILLSVLAAPVPEYDAKNSSAPVPEYDAKNSSAPVPENDAKNSSDIEPLLVPNMSKKFAEIFKYTLEICGAFNTHQANKLKDAIMMLTDALESFPDVQDHERILLEATAGTIARIVAENAAKDGGIFAKTSCVDQALKMAFKLTTGKPDHSFLSEVQRLIEVFVFEDQQGDSSYEGSYSSFYDGDYSDYDGYFGDNYYDGYYFGEGDYEGYFESPEYYEDYDSTGYFEYPGEMEYLEGMDPNLENGFLREEYGPYEDMGDRAFIEEPEFFELVPVKYGILEIPVEK